MKRIKRSHNNYIVDYNNNNNYKRLKFNDSVVLPSLLEHLPNEILYEIFAYLEITHAYDGFFDLNIRFRNLFLHSNVPIQVNISIVSKSTFQRYHKNIITSNQHRINYLRLTNPFITNIIFSPPRVMSRFVQLEKLVLDGVHTTYLCNILTYAKALNNLHSFVINLVGRVAHLWQLWTAIFHLPHLTYCNITYRPKDTDDPPAFCVIGVDQSPIEHLVINIPFPCDSLKKLFSYLPNLRRLSIDSLVEPRNYHHNYSSFPLKHLQYVSLKLDYVDFDDLEPLITNYFHHVEVFTVTTDYDEDYLNAYRWERLITSSMPNLNRFDIRHDGGVPDTPWAYHFLINQFISPFWTERGWNFNHQHNWLRTPTDGIFYSTDPYRRKDYYLGEDLEKEGCFVPLENNLQCVQHLRISSQELPKNSTNYFPNVTQLTIQHFHLFDDESDLINLNRLVPLKRLTYLCIEHKWLSIGELIRLVGLTPKLHTIKLHSPCVDEKQVESLEQNRLFRKISAKNQVRFVYCHGRCETTKIQFLFKLFPQMKYLNVSVDRKEIIPIISHIFQENFRSLHCLASLCLTEIPKTCLQEVDRFIKSKNLLNNYSLKYLNQHLYIWW